MRQSERRVSGLSPGPSAGRKEGRKEGFLTQTSPMQLGPHLRPGGGGGDRAEKRKERFLREVQALRGRKGTGR